MLPSPRLLLPILLVSSVLALVLAPSARADVIYTFDSTSFLNWSFEVPTIITTDTIITNFLSFNIVPGSIIDTPVCLAGGGPYVELLNPYPGFVSTFTPNCTVNVNYFTPITQPGSYEVVDNTGSTILTISQTGVPEPSSLLLLAGGLTSLLGLRRKIVR
jgi:hypothetical protein